MIRCYICGSKNVVLHHKSHPRRTKDGYCKQTIWYICKDCGRKIYEEKEVSDALCPKKKKSGE